MIILNLKILSGILLIFWMQYCLEYPHKSKLINNFQKEYKKYLFGQYIGV